MVSTGVAVAGIVASQVVTEFAGDRSWFTGGRVFDTGPLLDGEVVEVSGFSISTSSGACVSHLLWVIAFMLLIGSGYALLLAPTQSLEIGNLTHAAGFGALGVLLARKSQPLRCYNIR